MRRYALRDDQWDRVSRRFCRAARAMLAARRRTMGCSSKPFCSDFGAGVPWRDLPARFGDWKIVYQRFNRWAQSGVFERVFRLLASDHDNEYMMIDATIVRARRHRARRPKTQGAQAIGRSRGRELAARRFTRSSTPWAILFEVMLSPGQDHDLTCAQPLIGAHVGTIPALIDRRQGVRRRRLHRRPQRSSDRPGHPIQIQPKNPAPVRVPALYCGAPNLVRAFFQQAQAFPGHRHALRQARQDFSSPPSTSPAPPSSLN